MKFSKIAFVLLSILASACGAVPASPTATPEVVVKAKEDYFYLRTFKDLADISDLVVVGHPLREVEIVNMSRDLRDPSRPSSVDYFIGYVIEVEVEETWQGQGPRTIYVIQSGGLLLDGNPGREPTAEEIAATQAALRINLLQVGERYVLPLRYVKYSYSHNINQDELFVPTYAPKWFLIREDGCVVGENGRGFEEDFPPQLLETMRRRFADKVDFPRDNRTSVPQADPACVVLEQGPNPYP